MSYYEIYNYLDGKNICNIFANLIVNKIHSEVPDAKTEITVNNVRNFFIVKGSTSYEKTIDLSELLRDFYGKHNPSKVNDVRVFDLITYNKEIELGSVNTNISSNKKYNKRFNELQNFVNSNVSKNILFNIKYIESGNVIYYDCKDENISQVITLIENYLNDSTLLKVDMSNECFISDRIYGLSPNMRLYDILLINIKNHVFKLGLGENFNCNLNSIKLPKDIENDDMMITLNNNSFKVKNEWLESLILDVFPFELNELNEVFGNLVDLESYIITGKCEELEESKYMRDFILV
jgi:hypothetical protein